MMMNEIGKDNEIPKLLSVSSLEYEETGDDNYNPIKDFPQKLLPKLNIKMALFGKFGRKQQGGDMFNKGRLYEEMGIESAKCGHFPEALSFYDLALHNMKHEDDEAKLIPTLLNKARAFKEIDLIRSCTQYKVILNMIMDKKRSVGTNKISKDGDLFFAQILIELAHVQCRRGEFFEGQKNFHSALEIRKRHLGEHEEVAFVWYLIGRANHIKRNYPEALEAYTNSLKILLTDCFKEQNKDLIQSIQRLLSDRTMLANVSTKHWSSNTV